MSDVLWLNGRWTTTDQPVIHVEDRGFEYGDAVYEVVKFLRKRPIFAAPHFRRLAAGLSELEIPLPWDEPSFLALCDELLSRTSFDEGTLYFQVSRGAAERSHFYPEGLTPTALAYSRRFRFPGEEKKRAGIAVITTDDLRGRLCHIKSVNLLPMVLAKKKAQRAGADEALFMRELEVTEGASSSFFAVREGRIITHPTDCLILAGTVRDQVISIALAERIRVDERPVHENELFQLEEAFITSTTQGVMPVTSINGRMIGNGQRGEITGLLQQRYEERERSPES